MLQNRHIHNMSLDGDEGNFTASGLAFVSRNDGGGRAGFECDDILWSRTDTDDAGFSGLCRVHHVHDQDSVGAFNADGGVVTTALGEQHHALGVTAGTLPGQRAYVDTGN